MDTAKRKRKPWRVTYFTGDFFSSAGEQMHTTIIMARSEVEAEETFNYMYKRAHLATIEEVPEKKTKKASTEEIHNGNQT